MTIIRPSKPIHKVESKYKNGVKDGKSTGYYENGNKAFECYYKNGVIVGVETKWYETGVKRNELNHNSGVHTSWNSDGIKSLESHYKNEKLDGTMTRWYDNGHIANIGNYKQGDKDGEWINYYKNGTVSRRCIFNSKGNNRTCSTYDKEGVKISEGQYLNNSEEGVWTYWGPSDIIMPAGFSLSKHDFKKTPTIKVLYKNGFVINITKINSKGQIIEEGVFKNEEILFLGNGSSTSTQYYDNGDKSSETIYKDGYKESYMAWYQNGQKSRQLIYTDRTLDIDFIVKKTHWHENGQKKYEGSFRYGTFLVGELFRWDEDGNKLS